MIGSTEWAEAHAPELGEKAIAYLNLDVAAAGGGNAFNAAAVPSLKEFMREVAADVPAPEGGSILERANRELSLTASGGVASNEPADRIVNIDNIG